MKVQSTQLWYFPSPYLTPKRLGDKVVPVLELKFLKDPREKGVPQESQSFPES